MVSLSQQQQRTVGFLKPDVIDRKTELMDLIKSNPQWEVTFEQELILSLGEAKVLYPQEDEASWLSSHPIYVFVLEGPNVVQNWLDYVGAKDPKEAKLASPQSLRACFGLDSLHNVCHATGSDKEAYHDLKWLQGLVVDDLSIPLDLDLENSNQSSQSNQSNKSPQPSKLSKLKKPTTVAASKIGVTSAASAATTGAHKSSSSSDAKKKSSMAIPRPRSSLGSRPTTPASGSKQGTTTKAQKTTPAMPSTAKIPSLKTPTTTATSAAKKPTTTTTAARSSRAPTAKGRKETKSSRLGARSESIAKQSPDSVTSTGPSNTKRLANTRGISKNTPGISVLTGRTRKNSRVGDRRKETPAPTNHTDDSGSTTGAVSSEDTLDSITEYKNDDDDKVPDNDTTTTDDLPNNGNNNNNNNNNTPYATESVTSASTSCSQHTSDHDAEVAAAMGVRIDSPSDLMDRRRSSSFSPASVASSLTRPETPEVDQLRQRFESLGKPSTTPTTTTKRTPSITPEVASRIKDLKPKDPAGSRVKSMVEFFMDEKLHNNNAPCGIGDLPCNTPPSTLDNHVSSFVEPTALLISLETEPVPRKEIDTASLDERKQQMAFGDYEESNTLDDNSSNSNTLIERRRGTCLYLEPSFCSAIETAVTATATHPVKRPSTNAAIFTPKQSRHSILAQIERQNALLEKDPKSICIQSNELRGHYSTVQQLVTDYQPLYSPPLSDDDNDSIDSLQQQQQRMQIMDWAFWQALLQDPLHVANKTPHLLSIKLRAGIPPHTRGLVWQAVCQSDCLHLETVYGQLCKDHSPHERVIKRDLTRTFPNVDMFKQENGPGQLALCRILVVYSLYDAHVGYCQGLAFLVGPLLMNMPEPQAFCVFVRMMETYEMRSMFTLDMEGLQLRLYQFSRLLEEHLPALAAHLDKHSIYAAMYASQWFLTLFAYAFPLDLVTRIYDILFVEGATETMMRVSIAMLQRSEQTILAEDEFEDLLDCVTTRKLCAPYMDDWSEAIHDAMALSNNITRQKLDALENQYAQQGQQEKKKTEQVLVSRLGSFWRRKSTKSASSKKASLERSGSDSGSSMDGPRRNKGHQPRNSMHSVEGVVFSPMPPTPSTIATNHHDDITEELLQALDQLRREHSRTIDELFETRMDKKDVESERDALKMTIMELERRYQTSSPVNTTSSNSVVTDQRPSLHGCDTSPTSTATSFVSCSNNNLAAVFHEFGNDTEAACSVLFSKDSTNDSKSSSFDSADSPPSAASSPIVNLQQPSTHSSSDAITIYDRRLNSDPTSATIDPSNRPLATPAPSNRPPSPTPDDGAALRTELVRVKVDHFEVQQQCERLAQEVDDLQSRLDMVNEGQLALVEKLVTMKSEMDDLLLEKKQHEEKWLDLVEENTQLTIQLQQQPSLHFLMDRIDELETSLAATKVRLAQFEASSDQVDGPRIGRSGSLYGRMWHAISPKTPTLRS